MTRRLGYAIAASLGVHLLIFWPASLRVLTKDTPSLLQATLRAPPQPPVEPLPPRLPPRAVSPAPTVVASPTPVPAPAPSEEIGDRPQFHESRNRGLSPIPLPVPVPAAALATATPAPGSPSGALITEAGASGGAVDGLRGYRLAIATQARRFKRYPAQAMASGWAGSAEIRVEVDSDGQPRATTVTRSSGHEALDRAALTMIEAGALRARLPESLRGKAFAVVLPVVFNLDDE